MDDAIDLALQAAREGWEGAVTPRSGSFHAAADDWEAEGFEDEDEMDGDADEEEAYWRSHDSTDTYVDLTEAKLNVLERQGCIEQYLILCQKAERHLRYALKLCDLERVPEAITFAKVHLGSAEEALALAERLRGLRHTAEALAMGEHGLRLSGSKARLGEWLGPLEETQERMEQALQAWLAVFSEGPSLERLMAEANSKNYPIAAGWLKRMKKAYQVLGKMDEWQAYLQGIKDQYKRRPALQAQLKRL